MQSREGWNNGKGEEEREGEEERKRASEERQKGGGLGLTGPVTARGLHRMKGGDAVGDALFLSMFCFSFFSSSLFLFSLDSLSLPSLCRSPLLYHLHALRSPSPYTCTQPTTCHCQPRPVDPITVCLQNNTRLSSAYPMLRRSPWHA